MTTSDAATLMRLEESLWRPASRFNPSYMDRVLADDFFEFGRSGRIWSRQDIIDTEPREIGAELPLAGFAVHVIGPQAALVTYRSVEVGRGVSNRASVWRRTESGWKLVFHQGTPAQE